MFGLKKESSGDSKDNYQFDLEAQLKDPAELRAMKEKIEARMALLKGLLRKGDDKQTFDQAQTLLHAYMAMDKVFDRVNRKSL